MFLGQAIYVLGPLHIAPGLKCSPLLAVAVVFLASVDASFITGVELFVDGGAAQV
jgi:NAD(P)-dependent dehydrogenase (short-subunit alcohol dehydrogenase family)